MANSYGPTSNPRIPFTVGSHGGFYRVWDSHNGRWATHVEYATYAEAHAAAQEANDAYLSAREAR